MPKWKHISKKAARTQYKRTHCTDCGKFDELLTEYFYPDTSSAGLICDTCARTCWCLWCGNFMAGIEEFDFSPVEGFCASCLQDMRDEDDIGEYDEDYDPYDDNFLDYLPRVADESESVDNAL